MSRVFSNQKFVNMPKHGADITGPHKVVRVHTDDEDYHQAKSLSSWLFMKYDMTYRTYRNKSKARRDELRQEFIDDTGYKSREEQIDEILAEYRISPKTSE